MDALFLDPKTHTKIDEFGGANIFFIKGNTYITPNSNTILKSITNDSLIQFAIEMGLKIERRDVLLEELTTFEEAAACGTAASVSPIGAITYRDKTIHISEKMGPITAKLRLKLLQTQYGDIDDSFGFVHII
jgi:branched-chain amino acid aminotransferase